MRVFLETWARIELEIEADDAILAHAKVQNYLSKTRVYRDQIDIHVLAARADAPIRAYDMETCKNLYTTIDTGMNLGTHKHIKLHRKTDR